MTPHWPRALLRVGASLLFILPLVWLCSAALYSPGQPLPTSLQLLPENPTLQNFRRIWEITPLARYTANSLLVAAIAVPLTLLTSSWAGFAIAHMPRATQRRLVLLSLAVLLVPGIALWVPRFLIYKELRLLESHAALIAPALMGTSPFYVLMYFRAFRRIPAALYDAARLDGASPLQSWRQIAMPYVQPTTLGVALLSSMFYWSDYISPLLYLRRESQFTLPVGLQLLQQLNRAEWGLLMAAATVASLIPMLLFFLLILHLTRRE